MNYRRLIAAMGIFILGLHATAETPQASLKDAYAPEFRVGVAISTPAIQDNQQDALDLIAKQFNSATSENLFKWESIHPEPNRYDFEAADRFVDFGEEHGMFLVGHTLIWHNQTPGWVFEDENGKPLSREKLLERMREHIHTVVGRYAGRVHSWDVVNEAVNDDGTMRDTPWRKILGDDYLVHAFRFAKEADPKCEVYYNDYNLHLADKRDGVVRVLDSMGQSGTTVDGIGMQGHWGLDFPADHEIEDSVAAFSKSAGKVMITELDINVLPRPGQQTGADVTDRAELTSAMNPYTGGLPQDVQQRLADRYAHLFGLFAQQSDVIDRVTLWGLDDGQTWHNNWPIRGRTAHSLLFDRSLKPKPAFDAVLQTAEKSNR
ncbi:endo-1,4-beta-xylanase [Aeoliella sp.]|uniref:endo-1,4-beta-xylanase n=1 Tax=Aeoliella sp. TaxID=2795800 RepID=UPI003CCBD4D0